MSNAKNENELFNEIAYLRIEKIIEKEIDFLIRVLFKTYLEKEKGITDLSIDGINIPSNIDLTSIRFQTLNFLTINFIYKIIEGLDIKTLSNALTKNSFNQEEEATFNKIDIDMLNEFIVSAIDNTRQNREDELSVLLVQTINAERAKKEGNVYLGYISSKPNVDNFPTKKRRGRQPQYTKDSLIAKIKSLPKFKEMTQTDTAKRLGMTEGNLRILLKQHNINIDLL